MDRYRRLEELSRVLRGRILQLCRERCRRQVRRLEQIPDTSMRGRAFLREMVGDPPEVMVEMLNALEGLASSRDPGARTLFLDLLDETMVREVLPRGMIEEIWRIGRTRGYQRVLEVFFYTSGIDARLDQVPRLPPEIRDIPLGRRKSMARTGTPRQLEMLQLDNNVEVIAILLCNPRITEREVVHLAAHRPASPAVLTAVAADRRWIARYPVKMALVYNPDTPIHIAVPLLKFLLRQDLVALSRASSLNAILKRAAQDLLERR